jgi:hypothetical protein
LVLGRKLATGIATPEKFGSSTHSQIPGTKYQIPIVHGSLFLMLHIANGESVTGTFQQVRFPGTYLAWKDSLHDGPVPKFGTLSELSDVRAQALAGFGWGEYEKLRADFTARDRTLQDFGKHQDVVLWFEHDLLRSITASPVAGLV